MSSDDAGRAEAVRDRYRHVFGHVPAGIDERLSVAKATGRLGAVETIEALRQAEDQPVGRGLDLGQVPDATVYGSLKRAGP